MITHLFPGAGINPFTVWDLSFQWWMVFVAQTKDYLNQQKENRRGH